MSKILYFIFTKLRDINAYCTNVFNILKRILPNKKRKYTNKLSIHKLSINLLSDGLPSPRRGRIRELRVKGQIRESIHQVEALA